MRKVRGQVLTMGLIGAIVWLVGTGASQAETLTGTGCVEGIGADDHASAIQQARNAGIADALRRVHVPDPGSDTDLVLIVPREKVSRLLKRGWLGSVNILDERRVERDLCVTVQFTLDNETKAELAQLYGQPVAGGYPSTRERGRESPPPGQNQPMIMSEREGTGAPRPLQTAQAEESSGRNLSNTQVVFGERTWITSGRTDFNFGGPGGSPNIVSELNWDHLQSTIQSVYADVVLANRYLLLIEGGASIGSGGIHGGTMKDSDFLGDNRTGLFSESQSRVNNGNVWYISVDVGRRLGRATTTDARGNPHWALDLLAGYQHWRENYQASQGVQTQDPFGVFGGTGPFPNQGPGVNETYGWDMLRIGGQLSVSPVSRLSIRMRAFAVPYSALSFTDFHFFRGLGSPFITGNAYGGSGFQGNVAVAWTIWRTLALELGYQYWQMTSASGAVTFFDQNQSVTGVQPLNPVHTSRQGVTVGLSYQF